MKVIASRQFAKQLLDCPQDIQKRFAKVYDQMVDANYISDIKSIKKLTGFSTFYRVRIGHYRLGFEITDDGIQLLAIMHRKEIYRYFP